MEAHDFSRVRLHNALNDLTPKDFDNLLVGILSMLLDYSDEDKG